MELQNHPMYQTAFKQSIAGARANPLLSLLHNKRDFIVHRGMLAIDSKGIVGTTEGRGIKIAIGFYVSPSETTQEAYARFKDMCKSDRVIRGMAGPDCDSWPIIRREWKIPELPETELLEVAVDAWRATGTLLSQVVAQLGAEELDLSFSCRHDPEIVRTVQFSQREFFLTVDGIDIDTEPA